MLIYIRKNEINAILAPFSEDDIPKHIGILLKPYK